MRRLTVLLLTAALAVAGLMGAAQGSAAGAGPASAHSAKKLKRCAAKQRKSSKRSRAKKRRAKRSAGRRAAKRRAARRRARRLRALKRACLGARRKAPRGTPKTGSTAPGSAPGAQPLPKTPTTPTAPLGRYLSVGAREYAFTLSRPSLATGSVTVELRNLGEDPHNLVVSPDDGSHSPLSTFTETAPGGLDRRTLDLPRGRYRLWCSLAGHEALGMQATLRIGY